MASQPLLPYDVNAYLQADATLQSYMGTFTITPLIGAEACVTLSDGNPDLIGKPSMRYFWMPNIMSLNTYFIRRDRIKYYVMGRSVDAVFQVSERLLQLLDRKNIEATNTIFIPSTNNRIFESNCITSQSIAPTEKLGIVQMMLEFDFRYTQTVSL